MTPVSLPPLAGLGRGVDQGWKGRGEILLPSPPPSPPAPASKLEEHREEIEALLTAIETAGPSILRQLDAAIAAADSMTAAIKNLDAARPEEARAAK